MTWATADADGFEFHELRHTYASIIGTTGVELKYAQDRLGYVDISVPLNTYTTSCQTSGQRLPKKIEEAIV